MSSAPERTALITAAGDVMRELMARAVLFQDAVAKSAGLNATDMQCANLLLLYGPATPGELAGLAGLTAGGAITGALDRLERAGLVRRSRDGADRRRVVVTADADELWRRVGPSYERIAIELEHLPRHVDRRGAGGRRHGAAAGVRAERRRDPQAAEDGAPTTGDRSRIDR